MSYTKTIKGQKYNYESYRDENGKVKTKYLGKVQEKYYPEMFPMIFYMLGMFQATFVGLFQDSWWISWVILAVGLTIYWYCLKWFNYELKGYQKEVMKRISVILSRIARLIK